MVKKRGFSDLYKKIIKKGLCTGCGTCVGVCPPGAIQFDFDKEEPVLNGSCTSCGLCCATCPGGDIPLAKLERKFLGAARTQDNEDLGVSKTFLKGYAKDPEIRQLGASGGLATALLLYLLDQGAIDGAIVAVMSSRKPWRVEPVLARTKVELIAAAKSKYAVCPNNMMLKDVKGINRLAVVGLPCHVHGIRKVQFHKDLSRLAEKIVFVLGIFCGTNRSYTATELMIKGFSDVNLEEIKRFEYRGGASSQDVKIFTHDHREITITAAQRLTIFENLDRDRCRMCCDSFAELADLSIGDIFDPEFPRKKIPNWNSMIIRSEKGARIIEEARQANIIEAFVLEEDSFYGNVTFERKKHGAVMNLKERKRFGWPVPNYHYEFPLKPKRKRIYSVPIEGFY